MDTDFFGAGLRFHQFYAARPEHSGMVVLRPFLHASRMGLAALLGKTAEAYDDEQEDA